MIYLDASVALAQIFAEDLIPPAGLWDEPLASSRLLHYEVWNRVHARRFGLPHGDKVRDILDAVIVVELSPPVLARALSRSPRRSGCSMRSTSPPWTFSGGRGSLSSWPATTAAC